MSRVFVLVVMMACGSESAETTSEPPANVASPVAEVAAEPPIDACASFIARARHVAAADPGCSRDEDCACRSGLLFSDCGGPASRDTAVRLTEILREASRDGCSPEGPRCAPRECAVACVDGRCVDR